jgi:hypothetical protein
MAGIDRPKVAAGGWPPSGGGLPHPCRDRVKVSTGLAAQRGGLAGDRLIRLALVESLLEPGDLGEREGASGGYIGQLGDRADADRTRSACPPSEMPGPCPVIDARTRRLTGRRIMICLAGASSGCAGAAARSGSTGYRLWEAIMSGRVRAWSATSARPSDWASHGQTGAQEAFRGETPAQKR